MSETVRLAQTGVPDAQGSLRVVMVVSVLRHEPCRDGVAPQQQRCVATTETAAATTETAAATTETAAATIEGRSPPSRRLGPLQRAARRFGGRAAPGYSRARSPADPSSPGAPP